MRAAVPAEAKRGGSAAARHGRPGALGAHVATPASAPGAARVRREIARVAAAGRGVALAAIVAAPALALAACGGAPPLAAPAGPPAPRPARWHHVDDAVDVWQEPRPEVDVRRLLPDVHEELRWPLAMSSHPELVPRFPIAERLAEPGVDWLDLCARGAQHRHVPGAGAELVAYLGAWCREAANDDEAAVAELAHLIEPTVSGLGDAVRLDLADILANRGGADAAMHLLAADRIEDVRVYDALAATYVEVGEPADAFAINTEAIDRGTHTREADRCRREVRRLVLGPEGARALRADDFRRAHVLHRKIPDPTCLALVSSLDCLAAPTRRCTPYLKEHRLDPKYAALFAAYFGWPSTPEHYDRWIAIARHAASAAPLPGARALADAALHAAAIAAHCLPGRIGDLIALERTYTHPASASVVLATQRATCDIPWSAGAAAAPAP